MQSEDIEYHYTDFDRICESKSSAWDVIVIPEDGPRYVVKSSVSGYQIDDYSNGWSVCSRDSLTDYFHFSHFVKLINSGQYSQTRQNQTTIKY